MKKIMILAASFMFAVAANATTTSWGILCGALDKDGNNFTGGTAFLFTLTGEGKAPVWNTETGAWNMNGATLVAFTLGSESYTGRNYDSVAGLWGDVDATSASTLPDGSGVTAGGEQYFAIVLTSEKTSDFASFKGDDKYAAVVTGQGYTESGFDPKGAAFYYENFSYWDTVAQGDWTQLKTDAVPEPTSGLLLLLGVAGLALRRRRA